MYKILFIFLLIITVFAFTSFCWADYSTSLTSNTPPSNNDFSDYMQVMYDNFTADSNIINVFGSKDSFFQSLNYLTCTYVNYQGSYYLNIFMSEYKPTVTSQGLTFPPSASPNGILFGQFYMSGSYVKLYLASGHAGSGTMTATTTASLLSQSEIYANYDDSQVIDNYIITFENDSVGVVSNNNVIIKDFDNINSGGGSGGGDNSGGSGSSADYSNVLNHIDSTVVSIDNTTTDISSSVSNIDNNVTEIRIILESQSNYGNEISNTISSTSATTQNVINATASATTNAIQEQTLQSQNNFNIITNTVDYNISDVGIDTSFNTITDVNGVDNFINTLYLKFYNFFNSLNTNNNASVVVPLPFTNKSFTITTNSLHDFYNTHVALANLITMFWYVVFGRYIFRLSFNLWIWSANGMILSDTNGLVKKISDSNVLIQDIML